MTTRSLVLVAALVGLAGCAALREPEPEPVAEPARPAEDRVPVAELEAARAETEAARDALSELRLEVSRLRQENAALERRVERLRADLGDAEQALVALESGLRDLPTRADSVSALADARIVVARAARAAPWRGPAIEDAREKLSEAERHIESGHFGSAVFFTARSRRIAEEAIAEAEALREDPDTRYIRPERANVRQRPSMEAAVVTVLDRGMPVRTRASDGSWIRIVTPGNAVGWIYGPLLAGER